jgi:hypothetical protein
LAGLAGVLLSLGDTAAAAEHASRGLALMGTAGSRWRIAHLRVLGTVGLSRGAGQTALEHLWEGQRLWRAAGSPWWAASTPVALGWAHLGLGQANEAAACFAEGTACLAAVTNPHLLSIGLTDLHAVLGAALAGLEAVGSAVPVAALIERLGRAPAGAAVLPGTPSLQRVDAPAVLPTPPPAPWPAALAPGWTWIDPAGDCSHTFEGGLVLRAANARDLWHVNLTAPRLLQPAPGGAFAAQTVCGPLSDEQPAIGGLVLWHDKENYLVLERGRWGATDLVFRGCLHNEDRLLGRGYLPAGHTWLRLERQGDQVRALCSADGEEWSTVGDVAFAHREGEQIGVHAIGMIDRTIYHGAYPEGTAIRFESFALQAEEGR